MEPKITVYKRTTDVQQTWREFGWTPPSEDLAFINKWKFYRTLNTEINTEAAFDTCYVDRG